MFLEQGIVALMEVKLFVGINDSLTVAPE